MPILFSYITCDKTGAKLRDLAKATLTLEMRSESCFNINSNIVSRYFCLAGIKDAVKGQML